MTSREYEDLTSRGSTRSSV